MRICLVISGLGLGGAERLVVRLADNLARRHHEVMLVHVAGDPLVHPEHPAVRVHGLGVTGVWQFCRAYLALRRLLREFRPDVVHSHLFHANVLARLVRLTMPLRRLVCSAHNTNEEGRFRLAAYRATDWLADEFTNVSQAGVAAFEAGGAAMPGRMKVVYNAVSTEEYRFNAAYREAARRELSVDRTTCLIVSVGRLDPSKDFGTLLRACALLRRMRSDIRVAIVGGGPERDNLERLARQLDVDDLVTFLGQRSDVPSWLSAADVFVLSSAWEGFGLVVAEAMSCERLVVATAAGGIPEVVGPCGVLVPVGRPGDLAAALNASLALPEPERARRAERARRRVEELFSEQAALAKWLGLYAPTDQSN